MLEITVKIVLQGPTAEWSHHAAHRSAHCDYESKYQDGIGATSRLTGTGSNAPEERTEIVEKVIDAAQYLVDACLEYIYINTAFTLEKYSHSMPLLGQ